MSEEVQDVQEEATSTDSSTETEATTEETTEPSTEDVQNPEESTEEGETVPKEAFLKRLSDEREKRKAAEEMLQQYQAGSASQEDIEINPQGDANAQAWLDYINKQTETAAKSAEERARAAITREMEMKEVAAQPDFALVQDAMKDVIAKHKSLTPLEAYNLAKAQTGIGERVTKQQIAEQVKAEEADKKKASVGESGVRKERKKAGPDIINARDESGNFKYSLKELEEMLKGS